MVKEDKEKLEERHENERQEWKDVIETQFKRMNDQAYEQNKLSREHSNILTALKIMLETHFK